jgi:hypothetical protein
MLFSRCLLSRLLSLSFFVLVPKLRMGLLSASIVFYLRLLMLL